MINSIQRFFTTKLIVAVLALATVSFVAESCGQKHACGTKHQKKQRHKRIKKGTTFMSGFNSTQEVK